MTPAMIQDGKIEIAVKSPLNNCAAPRPVHR